MNTHIIYNIFIYAYRHIQFLGGFSVSKGYTAKLSTCDDFN